MKRTFVVFGPILALAVVGACSSSTSGGDPTCGKVAACGGNIVGTWKISDVCTNGQSSSQPSPLGASCPSATLQVGSASGTGTIQFNADMTYSVDATLSESAVFTIPSSCLSGATCDELTQAFQSSGADAGLSGQCSASGSGCNCTLTASTSDTNETGTYAVSGTTVTTTPMTPPNTTGSTSDFCVVGNTLHFMSSTTMTMGAMGQANVSVDIVAHR